MGAAHKLDLSPFPKTLSKLPCVRRLLLIDGGFGLRKISGPDAYGAPARLNHRRNTSESDRADRGGKNINRY